ncbi:GntR family transcriptional regulator [Erythrobacter sp. NFXS35]|uniref:GntR family transcriptional regulator n=1 Tax=Erythrobacter sp. NFXS35 TaxID=2818436 RepID=UPI0032E0240A
MNNQINTGQSDEGRSRNAIQADRQNRDSPPTPAEIVQDLLQQIQMRRLYPGERLKEQELAAQYNASRARVREALRLLESKGVVVIEPMRGASVSPMSSEAIFESVEIATSLFAAAAQRASKRITVDELLELGKRIEELDALAGTSVAPDRFFRVTLRLGQLVLDAANAPRLASLLADVRAGWPNILGATGFTTPPLRRRAVRNWRVLHAALASGNGRKAQSMAIQLHDDVRAEVERVGW